MAGSTCWSRSPAPRCRCTRWKSASPLRARAARRLPRSTYRRRTAPPAGRAASVSRANGPRPSSRKRWKSRTATASPCARRSSAARQSPRPSCAKRGRVATRSSSWGSIAVPAIHYFSATWQRPFSSARRARCCSSRARACSEPRPRRAPARRTLPRPVLPPAHRASGRALIPNRSSACRRELMLGNEHPAAHARGREGKVHLRFGRARQVALDHESSEATVLGRGHVGAALLGPCYFDAAAFADWTALPFERSLSLRHRKRAVARGVVEKFEDRQAEALGGFRLEHDTRPFDDDLRARAVEILRELRLCQLVQRGAVPTLLHPQVMRGGERLQSRTELFHESVDRAGVPRGLPGHCLNDRQQVFRTVREFAHQQAQMNLAFLARGVVDRGAEQPRDLDRKSTRLNSSHVSESR